MKKLRESVKLILLSLSILAIAMVTPVLSQQRQVNNSPELEIVAQLNVAPGNIAVGSDGRIFLSLHQAYQPELKVVELLDNGSVKPFPDRDWNNLPDFDGTGIISVLGIQADRQGIVWMLDNAAGVPYSEGGTPKIVAWNTKKDRLDRFIPIPNPVSRADSFINDLAVDKVHNALYLADVRSDEGPAIIVVDLNTGLSRRVLSNHSSFQPEEDAPIVIDDRETRLLGPNGQPLKHRSGLNPITIDPEAEWVYYGSMNGTSVWRVKTSDLLDTNLSDRELGRRVKRYGDKPVSDGISIDNAGNVYITDLNDKAIGITKPDGSYEILVQDDRLLWPDSLSAGADGYMYVAVNQLHLSSLLNAGENESRSPYYVMRFKAPAELVSGR